MLRPVENSHVRNEAVTMNDKFNMSVPETPGLR
jgi:hypothetical protein